MEHIGKSMGLYKWCVVSFLTLRVTEKTVGSRLMELDFIWKKWEKDGNRLEADGGPGTILMVLEQ